MVAPDEVTALDRVVLDLRELRVASGNPSFTEVAQRVADRRRSRGVPDWEARVGRTTVYDAFRLGRRRLDAGLVGEIVGALGGDAAQVEEWRRRAARAHLAPTEPEPDLAQESGPAPEPAREPAPAPWPLRVSAAIMVGCVLLNLFDRGLVEALRLPAHLDMVGTAITAVILGPRPGALVGLVTNVAGVGVSGLDSLPFALVNVAGALAWGCGVRSRWGRTIPSFFLLNLAVGALCTLVATPILLAMGGTAGPGTAPITENFLSDGASLVVAVLASNILISLADKVISGFVALVVTETLPADRRAAVPLLPR